MKELQIIVAGQANTGKSTMLLWLEQVLLDAGFTIETDFELEKLDYGSEEKFREAMAQHVTERENAVMQNTKITLTSKQIQRGSQRV
jgi:hypothetical protein